MTRCFRRSLFLLALLSLVPAAAHSKATLQVHLNKKPVDMANIQSAVLSDEVFVPARQFAESTGATVSFDSATGTLTVTHSTGIGVLKLGSHAGRIKGTKVYFPSAPYMSGGHFYAPMLFFSEMFDQAWYWDPFYGQFRWVPIFPRWRGYRPPMVIPGPGGHHDSSTDERQTSGSSLVRPLPSDTNPRIVVRTGSSAATYPVAKDAVILRGIVGSAASEVPLSFIRPGDKLTFQRDAQGRITLIRAMYKQVSGRITAINGNVVTLDTGDTLRLGPQTDIFLPDSTVGMLADLMIGDAITASMDPDTGSAYVIQVQPTLGTELNEADRRNPIAVNSWGPLNAGDVLVVRFTASPKGQAWFTVPGVQANAKMTEISPGVYEGSYVVQPGDQALREPIKVTFVAEDGSTYTQLSRRPIVIRSLTNIQPRIIYPHQGQQIVSPVVVSGTGQPGSLVRVIVEFRRNAQGWYPLQGVTDVQDVRVAPDGHWQTRPLAAVAPFSDAGPDIPFDLGIFTDIYTWEDRERPTIWTITAASVLPNGEERSAYSIDVTKSPARNIGGFGPFLVELKAGPAG